VLLEVSGQGFEDIRGDEAGHKTGERERERERERGLVEGGL
jgi:hypothetical protein